MTIVETGSGKSALDWSGRVGHGLLHCLQTVYISAHFLTIHFLPHDSLPLSYVHREQRIDSSVTRLRNIIFELRTCPKGGCFVLP